MRAIRNLLSVSIVLAALVLLPATAASAHDSLLESSPAAGATIATELTEVILTFSDVPLTGAPAVIQVTDATGTSITTGELTATDRSLSVPVQPASVGEYSVVYQVVSSDAHTISGDFTFTYSGPVVTPSPSSSASEPAASATPEPSPSDSAAATVPADPSAETASGTSASADAFLPLIIAVLAAVVIAVVAAVARANTLRRRGAARDDDGEPRV